MYRAPREKQTRGGRNEWMVQAANVMKKLQNEGIEDKSR
jgi:hypothetical protein